MQGISWITENCSYYLLKKDFSSWSWSYQWSVVCRSEGRVPSGIFWTRVLRKTVAPSIDSVKYKVVYVVNYMSTATFVGHRLLYSKLTYWQVECIKSETTLLNYFYSAFLINCLVRSSKTLSWVSFCNGKTLTEDQLIFKSGRIFSRRCVINKVLS